MAGTVIKLVAAAAGALAASAVIKELTTPATERTWHGQVAGVPYDFRAPTAEKLTQSLWDPANPKLFVPHAFGVGWSVNLARLADLSQPSGEASPPVSAAQITGGEAG